MTWLLQQVTQQLVATAAWWLQQLTQQLVTTEARLLEPVTQQLVATAAQQHQQVPRQLVASVMGLPQPPLEDADQVRLLCWFGRQLVGMKESR